VWEAVLTQAIDDVVDGPHADEAEAAVIEDIRAAAQSWIDDQSNEPRRFVWVCEQLDLDPAAVRAAINKRKGTT
jgi:phytoene/squalene synthetase